MTTPDQPRPGPRGQRVEFGSAAACGCPDGDGMIRHRQDCPDPVVQRLGWHAGHAGDSPATTPDQPRQWKPGDRVEITGTRHPWRGHHGVIDRPFAGPRAVALSLDWIIEIDDRHGHQVAAAARDLRPEGDHHA